ncbi:MAG: amidase [Chloroflexota bacterium]
MDNLRTSLADLSLAIGSREVSPLEITRKTLAEIERRNPELNAFRLVLADEAEESARQAENDIAAGAYRGPLHGVPVAVKDLMDMRGTTTPAGSKVLADRVASEDSEVVARLKRAGAIIVGKTHMPEFAYSPASNNEHYGPVHNPWNLEHDTGGSSSGSGAAVAAGLAFGATGSDTGGSIRMPSSMCGLVGLKATYGRVSARGAQTLSWSLDHVGPMTRTVRDAALMLDVMAGYDPGDIRTRRVRAGGYTESLEAGVVGMRVGRIVEDGWDDNATTPAVLNGVDRGVAALKEAGAVVVDLALPEIRDLNELNLTVLNLEAAAYYERYLSDRYDDIGQWTRDRLLGAYAFSPTTFIQVMQARTRIRRRVERLLAQFDLIALPGVPHEAPPLGQVNLNGRYMGPFNTLGWPAIVVPTDLGEGNLPVSMQLVGKPWRERTLLRAARTVERDGPWNGRTAPVLE